MTTLMVKLLTAKKKTDKEETILSQFRILKTLQSSKSFSKENTKCAKELQSAKWLFTIET